MGREDAEPHRLQPDPPEGDRDTIERELQRQDGGRSPPGQGSGGGAPEPASDGEAGQAAAPGDEARPGEPGTGENVCRACGGTGRVSGEACPVCGGTGTVVEGIGGG